MPAPLQNNQGAPQPIIPCTCSQASSNQVLVSSSLGTLISDTPNRVGIKITNLSTNDIWIGFGQGVTSQTGDLLAAGRGTFIYLETISPIYAIAGSADSLISFIELV